MRRVRRALRVLQVPVIDADALDIWLVEPEGSPRALEAVQSGLRERPAAHCIVLYFAPVLAEITQLEAWCALKNLNLARLQLHFTIRNEPQELPISAGALEPAKLGELIQAFCAGAPAVSAHLALSEDAARIARQALRAQGIEISQGTEPAHRMDASTEIATSPGIGPPSAGARGYCQVTATLDGRTRHFSVDEGETVLEAGERAGLALPFSCRSAVCATCRTRVISGSVEMTQNYALEDWELAAGFILACQARPTSAQLSISYDER